MAVVHCMNREHMLHSSETIKEVEKAIEKCLAREEREREMKEDEENGSKSRSDAGDDEVGGEEVESLMKTVKGMVGCLYMVVDDLVPMLPPDFNVLSLFQKAVESRIQHKVGVFYSANKSSLSNEEILTLLSWVDSHKTIMGR